MANRTVPTNHDSKTPADRSWTRFAIVIPWLLSILAFVSGVWQFSVQQKAANRRPFLEKQLAVTFEAADTAATIATTTDAEEWQAAKRNFARLEYGQLRIVEDRMLSLCIADFANRLARVDEKNPPLPLQQLEPHAINIADRARELIAKSWNVDLDPLNASPAECNPASTK